MPGRNDPCPCGSGKKYKNCHQREDDSAPRALRVIRGGLGQATESTTSKGGMALPPDATVPTDYWEVDLMPFAADITDDPTTRTTLLMVGAGEYVLNAEVLTQAPAEVSEVAVLLSEAVASACRATGRRPSVVLVRLDGLIDPVAECLADPEHPASGAHVSASRTLVRLDDALAGLEAHAGVPRDISGNLLASHPRSWAGWGFAPDDIKAFFEACEAFYRALPWLVLEEIDPITVRTRDNGLWEGVVLGSMSDGFGLSMYEDPADLFRLFEGPEGPAEAWERVRGAVLSLVFERRDDIPKAMREEIKRERWPVVGPKAYPYVTAVNTPGGGITTRQFRALTTTLRAIPGFVEKHRAAITGTANARFPLRYTDKATGTSIELQDVP